MLPADSALERATTPRLSAALAGRCVKTLPDPGALLDERNFRRGSATSQTHCPTLVGMDHPSAMRRRGRPRRDFDS